MNQYQAIDEKLVKWFLNGLNETRKEKEEQKSNPKYYKIKFHNPRFLKDDVNGQAINRIYTDLDQVKRIIDKLSKMEKESIIKDFENNKNPEAEKKIKELEEKGYTFINQDENIVSDEWKRLKISEYNAYSIIRDIKYENKESSTKMCIQLVYIEEVNNIGIPLYPLTDGQVDYLMILSTN